jgi:hypothetical protein
VFQNQPLFVKEFLFEKGLLSGRKFLFEKRL